MLSFTPSPKLEKALKAVQGAISVLLGELDGVTEDEAEWLHRSALISSVGASTRIENAVLTDAEVDWVDTAMTRDGHDVAFAEHRVAILDKLSKDRERSVEEVVGCWEVMGIIYVQAKELYPLTETAIRGLHHTLLRHFPGAAFHAGGYKTSPNQVISVDNLTGARRTVLDPAPPGPRTEVAMRDLMAWYDPAIKDHPWPLLVAAEFVFRFLAIHPFQDGNGRLGRVLFLLALMQSDDADMSRLIRFISIDRQIERHRSLYYNVLHQASDGMFQEDASRYALEPLAWFFLRMLEDALRNVALSRRRYAALRRLPESAVRVLACFRAAPEQRLRLAGLMRETGLVRRTVQNALVILTDSEILQRLGAGPATRYQLIF